MRYRPEAWNVLLKLPERDRRSIYDDKIAGDVFDRMHVRAMLLPDDGRLTGRWLLDEVKS